MKLRPYPEYKDSGVPWLGEVPEHWKIASARQIGHFLKGSGGNKNDETEAGIPCVRYGDLYTTHEFFILNARSCISPGQSRSYTRIHFGDVLFAASGETIEDIGRSVVNLIRGEAYCGGDIIILRPTIEIDSRFLGYALESPYARYQKSSMGRGFTVVHIYGSALKSLVTTFPPLEEQTQVACFLDWKTAQIDRFIHNKRRLIELLKEQKQALINQAVTGRIDVRTGKPYPEYKDSGVPWLGKVPAGWRTLPIKRVVRFNPSKSETGDSPSVNKQVCFLPMEHISEEGEIDCSEKRQLSEVWEGFTYFRRGDVVLAKITPCFENGKGAYLSELETEYGFGTTEFFVLRPTQKIHGAFLRFVTATKTFRWLGTQNMTGAAGQQRVPSSFVKNFQIGLPPLDEQEAIVSFIHRISKSIGTAITRTQREIELIQEYRTRLIADVVTGKLDVRDVETPEIDEPEQTVDKGVITGDVVAQNNLEVAM